MAAADRLGLSGLPAYARLRHLPDPAYQGQSENDAVDLGADAPSEIEPLRAVFDTFHGALSDFGDWGAAEMGPGQPRLYMPDPAFMWPADRSWWVANDVDPHWAGIGADPSAIDQLVADPCLDVVPADPGQDPRTTVDSGRLPIPDP